MVTYLGSGVAGSQLLSVLNGTMLSNLDPLKHKGKKEWGLGKMQTLGLLGCQLLKEPSRSSWVAQLVKDWVLILAPVVISLLWDQVPCQAPHTRVEPA